MASTVPPSDPGSTTTLESDGSVLDLTRALVSIPSVNPDLEEGGTGEGVISTRIADWLRSWGFETHVTEPEPGRFNVLGRIAASAPGPRIILSGHTDTVGVSGMEIDPFDPVVRDGRLYGRGSADMKGGLASILVAAREHVRAGGPTRGELVVAFTADEEYASVGLKALLEEGFPGDQSPLAATEAIVCEPTALTIQPANKGFTWLELTVRGRAAHGSRPELGRDAIRDAGRILAALDRYELKIGGLPAHPLLGRGSIHAGTIRGGTAPPVYPDRCDLVLEARVLPGETNEEVRLRMEGILAELADDRALEVEVRQGLSRPGAEIPRDHPLVVRLGEAIRTGGRTPELAGMTAWVESAWFIDAGIPALCFGPGALDEAHTAKESVPVSELDEAVRILRRYLDSTLAPGRDEAAATRARGR